jgi:hypothetical protein
MEWITTEDTKPKFGELVLVYCKIYGRFLAIYEQLDNTRYGNWRDMQGNLGILPPIYWMKIPEIPNE